MENREPVPPLMVAVVGGSGSGKTWLAEALCASLTPAATRLSLDDFYRDLSHLEPSERAAVNFDDPAAIDWPSVREAMDALARGEAARVPVYDFATHTRLVEGHTVEPRPVLIWDGLWLLYPEWLRSRFDLSVFVECSAEERLARRIQRDVRERGRTIESVRAQFAGQVQPMHELYVEPQRIWATDCLASPARAEAVDGLLKKAKTARTKRCFGYSSERVLA